MTVRAGCCCARHCTDNDDTDDDTDDKHIYLHKLKTLHHRPRLFQYHAASSLRPNTPPT
jgi:hypothetical protein